MEKPITAVAIKNIMEGCLGKLREDILSDFERRVQRETCNLLSTLREEGGGPGVVADKQYEGNEDNNLPARPDVVAFTDQSTINATAANSSPPGKVTTVTNAERGTLMSSSGLEANATRFFRSGFSSHSTATTRTTATTETRQYFYQDTRKPSTTSYFYSAYEASHNLNGLLANELGSNRRSGSKEESIRYKIPVFSPKGSFMKIWQSVLFAGVIFVVLFAPLEVVYHWWAPPKWYKYFGICLDLFFMADVILHFNVAVIHNGHLVTRRRAIAIHYAQTFLFVDLVSNFPLDWFVGSGGKSRKLGKLAKFPKIIRFVRLIRVVRKEMRYVGTSLTVGSILMAAHYFSCMFTGVFLWDCEHFSSCPPVGQTYLEGMSISMAGFQGNFPTVLLSGIPGSSWLASVRAPGQRLNILEYLVINAMYLVGYLLVACLFGNIALAVSASTAEGRKHKAVLKQRREEMKYARIPRWLQEKVIIAYEYLWRFGGDMDGLIKDKKLSLDLRRTLALCLHGDSLRAVSILKRTSDQNLRSLAEKAEMRIFTPGDYMVSKGQAGNELFVIVKGFVQDVDDDGEAQNDEVLGPGQVVGEVCFLNPGARQNVNLRCLSFCRVLVLTLATFQELDLEDELGEIRKKADFKI